MNKILPLGAVFVIFAGIGMYLNGMFDGLLANSSDTNDTPVMVVDIPDMSMGDANAPITIIEYASYTCPHCATFHATTLKELQRDYINTGKVHFIHREVFFDRFGLWAAITARCGGADRYFAISDLIYKNQRQWAAGTPAEIAQNLRRIGISAGLSESQLDACFADEAMAQSLVALDDLNRAIHDIDSTPSLVIDGEKYPNVLYDDLRAILDAKL